MLSKKDKFCPHCGKAKELKQVDFLGQHFEAYVSTCDCLKNKEKEEKEANQVNKVTQEITKVMEKGNIGRRYYNADFANYQSNPQNKAKIMLHGTRFVIPLNISKNTTTVMAQHTALLKIKKVSFIFFSIFLQENDS